MSQSPLSTVHTQSTLTGVYNTTLVTMLLRKWSAVIVLVVLQTISFGFGDLVTSPLPPITVHNQSVSTDSPLPKPDVYSIKVHTDIKYRYATTVVTSRVANPANKAQEVSFTVVLPETAFISGFLMVIDEKVYKAYVKEKEEAKREYTQAVEQGLSAAHIEQSARDSNQFTVSVNVEPHNKVDFNLTYEQLLTRSLGLYSHVVNINPGQIVREMLVNVKINESAEIVKLQVPELQISNEISSDSENIPQNEIATIETVDPKVVIVNWSPTSEQQKQIAKDGVNGQLIVKYDVDREVNPQQILVNEGYFVHFFAPESLQTMRKHVIFVLDYSGSMGGRKLQQLKDAMVTILADFNSSDYFSLVLFSDKAAAWYPSATLMLSEYYYYNAPRPRIEEVTSRSVLSASEVNKKLAIDFLKSFGDVSGTNIIDGLRKGVKLAHIGRSMFSNEAVVPEPLIIFLTDGQPNVEMYSPEEIIREVKKLNTDRVAVFSLGFGYGADIDFLRKLSLSNMAFARNIYEASDAALQLKNFYKELASPILANITFNYLPGQVNSTLSSRISFPTYFRGSELVVVGKLYNTGAEQTESINAGELIARTSNGTTIYPIVIGGCCHCLPIPPVPTVRNEPSHLEKVWAYLTIQQLLDNITIQEGQELNETRKKALDLALQYSFVTPVTSLVVVKPNSTSAVGTEQVRPGSSPVPYGASFAPAVSPGMYGVGLRGLSGPPGVGMSMAQPPGFTPYSAPAAPGFAHYSAPAPPPAYSPSAVPFSSDLSSGRIVVDSPGLGGDVKGSRTLYDDQEAPGLDDVAWLKNYTAADGTVTVPLNDNSTVSLKLGRNEADISFGTCQVHGETGGCRHLEYCVLDNFKNSLDDFLPYRCDIPSGFLGVCCPGRP